MRLFRDDPLGHGGRTDHASGGAGNDDDRREPGPDGDAYGVHYCLHDRPDGRNNTFYPYHIDPLRLIRRHRGYLG